MAQPLSPEEKCRLIVTTDLGGSDPDDIQSMIHLLVCSDVIDIEGLISAQAWVNDPDKTDKIREVVNHFGEVLPRLKKHAKGYPELIDLLSVIKRGQEKAHMDGVGEGNIHGRMLRFASLSERYAFMIYWDRMMPVHG